MTMQSDQQGAGFVHSVGGQMLMLCVVLAVVLAGAWFYVF
jgi:hypothetical protein